MVKEEEDNPKRMNLIRLDLISGRIEVSSSDKSLEEVASMVVSLKDHFFKAEEKKKENPIIS